MKLKKKTRYVAPKIEVIHTECEGVMAASGSVEDFGNGGSWGTTSSSAPSNSYGTSAESNDIEDMLNDIFTVKQ